MMVLSNHALQRTAAGPSPFFPLPRAGGGENILCGFTQGCALGIACPGLLIFLPYGDFRVRMAVVASLGLLRDMLGLKTEAPGERR